MLFLEEVPGCFTCPPKHISNNFIKLNNADMQPNNCKLLSLGLIFRVGSIAYIDDNPKYKVNPRGVAN